MEYITLDEYTSRKKKKKGIENAITLEEYVKQKGAKSAGEDDIAPVRTSTKDDEDIAPVKEERTWFQKGVFDDGWQLGDGIKAHFATKQDTEQNLAAGILGMGEKIVDAGAYVAGSVYGWLGHEDYKEQMQDFISKDLYDEETLAKKVGGINASTRTISKLLGVDSEEDSLAGEKTDALVQSGGQLAATAGLQAVGVPWWVTTGATSFGGEAETALNEGSSYEAAGGSALITAGADILTEKLSGGIKFGGKTLDDIILKPLTEKITSKVVKNVLNLGIDAAGEGAEEVIAGIISNLGTALYKEESIGELLASEEAMDEYIESFIGGAVLGGGSSAFSAGANTVGSKKQTFTQNEQTVIDKEVENRVAERETEGKKLTAREKSAIKEQVENDLQKGYISIDTIESILGGKTYEDYKAMTDKESALEEEIEGLQKDPRPTAQNRLQEAQAELDKITNGTEKAQLKDQLSLEVRELTKNSILGESYNEKARRGQAFKADLSKYDAKQREVVKRAAESGILNNTNRTHEFVDMIAKISADKGVSFDFMNNESLKKSGFAVQGKTVNGLVKGNDVILNIDSNKALNTVVGHEITHVLEGTELYSEMQSIVKEYATTKGEYDARLKAITELYEGVEGAVIENELTAELIGEYLFTDSDFVNRLSTEKPNIFKKIYEEIKYLCKVATAGSKEARQLEKVKKVFEKAYKNTTVNTSEGVKFSLMEFSKDGRRFVEIDQDQDRFEGHDRSEYPRIAKDIINEKFNGKVIGIDNKMFVNGRGRDEFANPSKFINGDVYEAKMRSAGELDNLLDAGTNFRNEADGRDGHYHSDVIGGFDYYDTLFKIGNRYYEARVNIKNIERGKLFKDVTQIKDVTQDIMNSYGKNPKFQFLRTSSNSSISQKKQNATQNQKNLSLSEVDDEIAPIGKYNVYGKDIALEELGPVREDIATSQQTQTAKGIEGAPIRSDTPEQANAQKSEIDDLPIKTTDVETDYAKAEDTKLLQYIKNSLAESISNKFHYKISEKISDRLANDIERIAGFSVRGYKNKITPGRIRHIYKRHGKNGSSDNSLENIHDIAKIGYVIENYDKIVEGSEPNAEFKNVDDSMSKTVLLQKKIGEDYYYVVEAVPNSSAKALFVTAAYINKNDTIAEAGNALSPSPDVRNELQSDVPSNIIIPDAQENTSNIFDDDLPIRNDLAQLPVKATKTESEIFKQETENTQVAQNFAPAKGKTGEKQRKWVGTSTESEAVEHKVLPENLNQDVIHYQPIPNKKTLNNANAKLDSMGYDAAVQYFNSQFENNKISLDDVALGERLIQEAVKSGDFETAGNLIQNVSILGTELGQKVQALSIIKRLTPEGQLQMLQKVVRRGKAKGDKTYEGVEITQEMIDHILRTYGKDGSYDQNELNKAVEDVKKQIADQMKVTVLDKVNAWRYLSMLGNPKTHIRNLVSNVAMRGTVAAKNAISRTIETIAPVKNRTKTWKPATDAVKEFAERTTTEMKDVITGDSKYSDDTTIKQKREIFKNKILNGVYEFNSDMLEKEDWWFSKPAFTNSFSEYLTANGIETEQDIVNNPEAVEKAKAYAIEQSQIATFRQYSWLANKIGDIERRNTATNIATGSILPFKKTPVNIAKTGLSYSPLGFMKTLTYDVLEVKKGNMEASELVDHLAQNITGTALTLVGYMLASSGFLSGSGDDDKEGKYDYQLGQQAYAININGKSYSLSWLSPVAMPLFVGANAYEQLVEGKEWNGDVVVETLAQTLDPLSEMSFLSSLDSVLSSYDSGIQKFAGIAETAAQSYIGQFIPTLSSQVATVLDDTKRSTKVAGDSDFKFVDETINKLIYKIPFLRETLEPSTDIWGNEVKQTENVMTRAFETFIAPYSKRDNIATEIDSEIKTLYSETGENGIIPSVPYNYTNYDGVKYEMSASEYTEYKKMYGQTANNLLGKLFDTKTYQAAGSEEKADMISDVYDYARDEAKRKLLRKRGIDFTNATSDGKEYYKENPIKGAIKNDVPVDEYTFSIEHPEKYSVAKAVGGYDVYKAYSKELSNIEADRDENGKKISGSREKKVKDYIFSLDIERGEKIVLYKSEYPGNDTYNEEIIEYLNSREDISYSEKETILTELGFTVEEDGTVRW